MDGSFVNRPAAAGGGTGSVADSSAGDASCGGSVGSSAASSVSSIGIESSPALQRSLRGSEIVAVMPPMDSGSSVTTTGEPRSPSVTGSIDLASTSSSENPSTPAVEPINPFDQISSDRRTSLGSVASSSKAAPADGSVGGESAPTPQQTASLSPDRALPSTPSNVSASPIPGNSQRASSPNLLSLTSDGSVSSTSFNASFTRQSLQAMPANSLLEDDDTEPSSAVTSSNPGDPNASQDGQDTIESESKKAHKRNSSLHRFFENTRRRIGSTRKEVGDDPAENIPNVDDDLLAENPSGTLICGYLQKLGRNGKWQTRWFETDGECLSYYKSEKRTKLLATLDLDKVGNITIDPNDNEGVSFDIQVLGRLYHLRSDSKASCKDWVITLNRVKEARMQQGNVKLISVPFQQPVDLLDTPAQSDDFVAPRVVVLANRQRTKAVEEEQELNQLIQLQEGNEQAQDGNFKTEKRLSTIGTVVLARWTKRRSSISRLRSKFAKWARSLRRLNCAANEAAGLDAHVHPPGHDDHTKMMTAPTIETPPPKLKDDVGAWIGKEASISSRSPPVPGVLAPESGPTEIRPRKNSTASDNDVRVLS